MTYAYSKLLSLAVLGSVFVSGCTHAGTPVAVTPAQCTAPSCGNAAGEMPRGDVLEQKGKAILDEMRQSGDDKARWATVIYSEGTRLSELELTIIKSADFRMRLDPKLGTLAFSTPRSRHTFLIDDPKGREDTCPSYNVRIVEASKAHALIRYVCPKKEYRPGKFYMSNQFFLYDVETGTARSIWHAAAFMKDTPYPAANPKPAVKLISDGYKFDWVGDFPSDSAPSKMEIHNKYVRQPNNGKLALVCVDMSNPKKPAVENEMCEGEELQKAAVQ
jgi:hypothetical protein